MTKILGFAGKKQGGKTSACNCLLASCLNGMGYDAKINENGKILIYSDDIKNYGILDIESQRNDVQQFLNNELFHIIKPYSFASPLKEMLANLFDIKLHQLYGSDAQKNSLTELRWENMPGVTTSKKVYDAARNATSDIEPPLIYHPRGKMTARATMQFFGTDLMRKINENCWANATMKRIMVENPVFAVITDVRFKTEVEIIRKNGGKVIHLLRNSDSDDEHQSEKDLDHYRDWDAEIANQNMTIYEQAEKIQEVLADWGWAT